MGWIYRRFFQEADISPMDFTPSWGREQVVDMSEVLGFDPVVLISQTPKILLPPFLLLQVFQPVVRSYIIIIGRNLIENGRFRFGQL